MNKLDSQLKELYEKILQKDSFKTDRTGVGTKSIFGHQMRFDLRDGFPLTTLRKIHLKSMIHEMLWFLSSYDEEYKKFGNTNIRYLLDNGVSFWTEWPYEAYKAKMLKNFQENPKRKKLNILSQKEFEKKIMKNDNFALLYGDLGPVYGKQWIDWGGYEELVEQTNEYRNTKGEQVIVDKLGYKKVYLKGINQINKIIDILIHNPNSRRMLINAWNVTDLDEMLLEPCHLLSQFYTEVLSLEERIKHCQTNIDKDDIQKYINKFNMGNWEKIKNNPLKQIKILNHFNIPERYIDLQVYMRSNDIGLGNPYNVASYSLLLTMIGQIVNMIPRDFILTTGDTHIYSNHISQIEELIKREPKDLPTLKINRDVQNIYNFRYDDFDLIDYNPHPNIKMNVAV